MPKRKQVVIVAAALAASPLTAKAGVSITFAYDPTVTYGTNASLTAGTGTATILGNQVFIPGGDFFRFNVNVLVTGDPNPASGGAYDMSNGVTEPANLGLTDFGFVITDSAPANVVPRVMGGNAFVANLVPNNSPLTPYDVSSRGTANLTTGQVGTTANPLSGTFNPGNATGQTPSTFYRLTLGAGVQQDIFTGLEYQALAAGQAVLTPSNTAGSLAYAAVASVGNATTPPSYVSNVFGTNTTDSLTPLPPLTINPSEPPHYNSIIVLSSSSSGFLQSFGAQQGTLNVVGNNGAYSEAILAIAPGVGGGFVEGKGFFPSTDTEIYALDVTNGGSQATDIATIVNAINNGVAADSISASVGITASATAPPGVSFPSNFNLFLTSISGATGTGDNFMGWNLTDPGVGIAPDDVVSAVALVPEPASAAFLIAASGLFLGRRRQRSTIN